MLRQIVLDEQNKEEPFVGREKELTLLQNHLEKALNYRGQFILIQGDNGVGKTRLLNHFADTVKAPGIQILWGRTLKDEVRPFSPFTPMIEDYLENLEDRRSWLLKFLTPEVAPYLIHLMPRLKNHYPLGLPHFEQPVDDAQFLYAFEQFFENLSKFKLLVLILDDVMWMKEEAIELLRYIVMRMSDQPILCIATAHSNIDNRALQRVTGDLNAARLLNTINLGRLSRDETAEFLNQKFKSSMPNHFTRWLYTITLGNPLFIQETLLTLMRQNVIHYDDNQDEWIIENDYEDFLISATVESVINYRLDKIAPFEMQILQTAAVIGENINIKILRKLLGSTPEKQILKSCNILTGAKLIVCTGDEIQFSHPLIREMLYRKVEINERRMIHRQLAAILKADRASDEEIVYHRTKDLAQSEETAKLYHYLFNISKKFLNSYNYQLAWNYLKIAQKITDKVPGLNKEKTRINAKLNHLSWILGRDVMPLEEAERFAKELENAGLKTDAAIHYDMLFNRALSAQKLERAEKCLNKAISFIKKPEGFYWTLMAERLLLLRRKGLLNEAVAAAKKLASRIPPHQAPVAFYKALNSIGMVAILRGNYPSAHQAISRSLSIAKEYHLLPYIGDSYMNLGLVEMEMGNLDSALINFNESLKIAEILQREPSITLNLLYTGTCLRHKGEIEKAIQIFDRAIAKAEKIDNPRLKTTTQLIKASAYLELDCIREAEDLINVIPAPGLGMSSRCDLELIKGMLHRKKHEFQRAEEFADKTLDLAKNLGLEIVYARALGEKAIILLHKQKKDEALKYLADAKAVLLSKKSLIHVSRLLVEFGLDLGKNQGQKILLEGLKMLQEMGARAKIAQLYPILKKKDFNLGLKLSREILHQVAIEKTAIYTFGGLSVVRPGELNEILKKEWLSRKAQELLGLILMRAETGVTRETLASILWPETIKKKSQLNFRVALAHLKKILGNEVVIQQGQFLLLNNEIAGVDFWAFEALVKEWQYLKQNGKLHPAEDRARQAITLYRGDFLPEFYSPPIIDKQLELKNKMRDLLCWLAVRSMERIEYQEAISFARKLLTLDFLDERAHQMIIEGMYYQGDRTGALRQFEIFKKNLKEELHAEPGPETMKFHKKITRTD